jgi:hypothetical protein
VLGRAGTRQHRGIGQREEAVHQIQLIWPDSQVEPNIADLHPGHLIMW